MSSNTTIRSDSPSSISVCEESAAAEISDILEERAFLIHWLYSVYFHASNSSVESKTSLRQLALSIPSDEDDAQLAAVKELLSKVDLDTSSAPHDLALAAKGALVQLLPGTMRVFSPHPQRRQTVSPDF